jgi:hypothetical protein
MVANPTLDISKSIAVKPMSFGMTLHVATSSWTERSLIASFVMRATTSTVSGSQSNVRSEVQVMYVLLDEHACDVATGRKEETFDPADFSLLDSEGACAPAKRVTTAGTESPAPRIHGAIESLGSNKSVETPSTEADLHNDDQPDIEHEDLESRTQTLAAPLLVLSWRVALGV